MAEHALKGKIKGIFDIKISLFIIIRISYQFIS